MVKNEGKLLFDKIVAVYLFVKINYLPERNEAFNQWEIPHLQSFQAVCERKPTLEFFIFFFFNLFTKRVLPTSSITK